MPRPSRDADFSAFVRANRVELLRSACLLTAGDTHLAEDLVQTALARLYVAWHRVRPESGPLAYARRIVVNAHLDETRRSRWRRERFVAEPDETADRQPVSTWAADERISGEEVRAALAALPPRMRAVVVLRHWMDLSVEETAEVLGCSEGTVKSQTAKATKHLRALLTTTSNPNSLERNYR